MKDISVFLGFGFGGVLDGGFVEGWRSSVRGEEGLVAVGEEE